jgi:hypothetical protein
VYRALWTVLEEHGPFTLVHGDCATGADHDARHWFQVAGKFQGCDEQRFPASWEAYGRAAGPMRNRRMVAVGAHLVLAFLTPSSVGTRHTVSLARAAGIPVIEYGKEAA